MSVVRLILDPPHPGDWNMAVDEALLNSAAAGRTTLRFYQWSAPTLSLGYFQEYRERQLHLPSRDCACVRRTSGGGAILHDGELTYSFTAPVRDRGSSGLASVYGWFHQSLVRVLSRWGMTSRLCTVQESAHGGNSPPFLCFRRRAAGDVLLGDFKICGSAQRRQRGALLQHGSVVLQRSPCAPEISGIEEISGQILSRMELIEAWRLELGNSLGSGWESAELTPFERAQAEEIRANRFASPSWFRRR